MWREVKVFLRFYIVYDVLMENKKDAYFFFWSEGERRRKELRIQNWFRESIFSLNTLFLRRLCDRGNGIGPNPFPLLNPDSYNFQTRIHVPWLFSAHCSCKWWGVPFHTTPRNKGTKVRHQKGQQFFLWEKALQSGACHRMPPFSIFLVHASSLLVPYWNSCVKSWIKGQD